LVERAGRWETRVRIPESDLVDGLEALEEHAHAALGEAVEATRRRNDNLVERRLASLEAYYQNRRDRVSEEVAAASDSRIRRMKEAELARVEREHVAKRSELEGLRKADILSQRIAVGLLAIRSGDN